MKFETVFALQAISMEPVSLDAPADEETGESLADLLQDMQSPTLFEIYQENALRERLPEELASLPPRDREMLKLCFGIGCDRPHTLEEVGAMFGICGQGVRHIVYRSLRRLRHPVHTRILKEFL